LLLQLPNVALPLEKTDNKELGLDMDAQENRNGQTGPSADQDELEELRMRTDSESSVDSMTRFVLPSLDGTPPKIVTLDEVSSMFKNLRNMELAHEIALNPEFKLQKYEPPSDR